jgi:hypothetical protein
LRIEAARSSVRYRGRSLNEAKLDQHAPLPKTERWSLWAPQLARHLSGERLGKRERLRFGTLRPAGEDAKNNDAALVEPGPHRQFVLADAPD